MSENRSLQEARLAGVKILCMSESNQQSLSGRQSTYSREMTEVAKRLRRNSTPAEQRLWEIVRDRKCGPRFYRQVPTGQYVLDFYCPQVRLAIEVDGRIHHLPAVQERDRDRETALIEDLKLTILRLTNEAVLTVSKDTLREKITAAIEVATRNVPSWAERPARRR
jgi:very-short-patch-repair endonuclease